MSIQQGVMKQCTHKALNITEDKNVVACDPPTPDELEAFENDNGPGPTDNNDFRIDFIGNRSSKWNRSWRNGMVVNAQLRLEELFENARTKARRRVFPSQLYWEYLARQRLDILRGEWRVLLPRFCHDLQRMETQQEARERWKASIAVTEKRGRQRDRRVEVS